MLAAFCLLIGIYDSWNALCSLYAEGLLWARNVRQKAQWTLCALWEKKLRRLREKTPQQLAWVLSYREDAFYFSQKNTEEQNTQHSTETSSQPISQNLTATFSWNALWYLYAEGLLWVQNSAQMSSVRSVSSVREKISFVREGTVLLFYHVTFLSPNNALHDTKKVTNLSHHRLFTCLITRYKDKYKGQIKWETN